MTFAEDIVTRLVDHGVPEEEARFFVSDHGVGRAYVWLRTCEGCRGDVDLAETCAEGKR